MLFVLMKEGIKEKSWYSQARALQLNQAIYDIASNS
jgi:hypothetical protein